ncbi:MAG: hypothetical protein ACYCYI_06545 [Saccharofermentanales bacterium]
MKKMKKAIFFIVMANMIFLINAYKSQAVITETLYAKDFGAVASGSFNNTDAVRSVIAKAVSLGKPVEIMFEAGEFRFNADTAKEAAILLNGAKNITITGVAGKTVFCIENPMIGTFLLNNCENILIRNITIDYDPLPFTQGTVTAYDMVNCTIDINIDAGYSLPTADFFKKSESRIGITANLNGDETEYGILPILVNPDGATLVNNRIYRLKASNPDMFKTCTFKVGDRFFYKSGRYTNAGVCAWKSKNISLSDITIYAGPASATMWALNDKVHINKLKVAIKPGSGRLVAVNADVVHAFGTRNGLILENSYISGNGDDGVNLHSRAGFIVQVISGTKIVVNNGGCSEYRVGDTLQIFDYVNKMPRATVKVLSVSPEPYVQTITIDKAVGGINAGTNLSNSDKIFNLSACGQDSIFRNNVFGILAGRHLLIQSYNILISNNSFKSYDGWSVCISYDPNWGEGPQGNDVTISGNTFTGAGRARIACINIGLGGPKQGQRPFKNITISNNKFIDMRNTIISVNGVDGLSINNNISTTALRSENNSSPVVLLDNSNGVVIKDFTVEDPNKKINTIIHILRSMDSGNAGVKIENLVTKIFKSATIITDDRMGGSGYSYSGYSRKNSSVSSSAVLSGSSATSKSSSSQMNSLSASSSQSAISDSISGSKSISGDVSFSNNDSIDDSENPGISGISGSQKQLTQSDYGKIALVIFAISVLIAAAVLFVKKHYSTNG